MYYYDLITEARYVRNAYFNIYWNKLRNKQKYILNHMNAFKRMFEQMVVL